MPHVRRGDLVRSFKYIAKRNGDRTEPFLPDSKTNNKQTWPCVLHIAYCSCILCLPSVARIYVLNLNFLYSKILKSWGDNSLSNFIHHQVIERKKRTKTNIHCIFSSTLPYDEIRRVRRIKFQLINGDGASIEVLVTRYLFSIEPAL